MKVRESFGRRCEACCETPEIHNPNKHTRFDKFKIGGLSLQLFIGLSPIYIYEGFPQKLFVGVCPLFISGGFSIKLFIVVSPLYVSEGCLQIYLSEYVHYLFQRVVHKTIYRSKSTSKTNIFVLETIFIHGTRMCDRVGKDSRHRIGACRHSGRHVYVALGFVFDCANIACALR